jgi:hypothetical protein
LIKKNEIESSEEEYDDRGVLREGSFHPSTLDRITFFIIFIFAISEHTPEKK